MSLITSLQSRWSIKCYLYIYPAKKQRANSQPPDFCKYKINLGFIISNKRRWSSWIFYNIFCSLNKTATFSSFIKTPKGSQPLPVMLYSPLPIALVLEIFDSLNFRANLETLLQKHFMFLLHHLQVANKGRWTWETPGIPAQPEEAAKQYEANISPLKLISCLCSGRNYEVKGMLAPQDASSHWIGQCFVFLSPPSSPHMLVGVGIWLQEFMGVTSICQLNSHIQRTSISRDEQFYNSKVDKVTSLQNCVFWQTIQSLHSN